MTVFNSGFSDNDDVSDAIFMIRLRNWRNKQLFNSDWTQLADAVCDKAAWATHRQALRDMPASNSDTRKIEVPNAPQ